ncbi:MAG: FliM/FliN family flagellar motor switch protein [Rhizobiales bacterium]|nr:FliM/FliN family flagellar motor switch protein [Hyphomicrobiales bacterium]
MSTTTAENTSGRGEATTGNILQGPFANVKVSVQVMLGSTKLTLAEMLSLRSGSTITLDQKLGSPVSVIVNNCCVAKGELYVLEQDGNRLGVKITEMVEPAKLEASSV